jgi:hypothetical protein
MLALIRVSAIFMRVDPITSKQAGIARSIGLILVFKTLPSGVVTKSPIGLGGA